MKRSLLFSCLVWMAACGGAEADLEAQPATGPALSQQRIIPELFEQCVEDGECPYGYCPTRIIESSSCESGQATVCGDTRYHACG